jgi:hypothetical protein
MNATHYLYAAYVATGLIHTGYILSVVRRYQRARQKMRELNTRP